MGWIGIAGLVLALGAGGAAAETLDAAATSTGVNEISAIPVGEGEMVMSLASVYEKMEFATPEHPLEGMTGACSGTVLASVETMEGGGYCVMEKGDGRLVVKWAPDGRETDGTMTGSWEVVKASGALEGMTGRGRFRSLTDPETGRFDQSLDGSFER